MTIESMHFTETAQAVELNPTEQLTLRKIEVHHEIGRLCMELSRLNQELNAKIVESIELNQALTEAGADKHAIARMIEAPAVG